MSNSGGMDRQRVGLVGPAGSGKDSVAELLVANHRFHRVAFADALKEFVAAIDPAFRIACSCFQDGVDGAKRHVPGIRERLIEVGQAARTHITGDVWIDAVDDVVEGLPASVPVVVSDVRQQNEADWLLENGGQLVAVQRPGRHPEDRVMASLMDAAAYHVQNVEGLDHLEQEVDALAEWSTLRWSY